MYQPVEQYRAIMALLLFYTMFLCSPKTFRGSIIIVATLCGHRSVHLSVRSHFSTTPGPNLMKFHTLLLGTIHKYVIPPFFNLRLCHGKGWLHAKNRSEAISPQLLYQILRNFISELL